MKLRKAQERHDHGGYFTAVRDGTAGDPVSATGKALLDDNTWGAAAAGDATIPLRDYLLFQAKPSSTGSSDQLVVANAGGTFTSPTVSAALDNMQGRPRVEGTNSTGTTGSLYVRRDVNIADEPSGEFVVVFGSRDQNVNTRCILGFGAYPHGFSLSSTAPSADSQDFVGVSFDSGTGSWDWYDSGTVTSTGLSVTSDNIMRLTLTWDGSSMSGVLEDRTADDSSTIAGLTVPSGLLRLQFASYASGSTHRRQLSRTQWVVEW